jgi:cation-transporting ATPase E
VLLGLLTVIFVEPPTEWWTGGDELSGDWKPTLLAIGLMIAFFVVVLVKPLRDVFALTEPGAPGLVTAVLFAILWVFVVRALWRSRAFERYLGIKDLHIHAHH